MYYHVQQFIVSTWDRARVGEDLTLQIPAHRSPGLAFIGESQITRIEKEQKMSPKKNKTPGVGYHKRSWRQPPPHFIEELRTCKMKPLVMGQKMSLFTPRVGSKVTLRNDFLPRRHGLLPGLACQKAAHSEDRATLRKALFVNETNANLEPVSSALV